MKKEIFRALVESKLVELINDNDGEKLTKEELGQISSLQLYSSIQRTQSVSYPPNEAALIWSVGSNDSGSVRVRVSYVLGNLSKSFFKF